MTLTTPQPNTPTLTETPANTKEAANNMAGFTLASLLSDFVKTEQAQLNIGKTNKYHKKITPSRPPHGTRRAMGKR